VAIFWLAAMLVGWPAAVGAAEEPVGIALRVSGAWRLDGAEIKGGAKLPGGGTLEPEKPGRKSFIVVCFSTGEAKTYTQTTVLPKLAAASLTSRIWSAAAGHYHGGIVHAISRGDGIADGVAKLEGGQLDLAPLIRQLPAGAYQLQLVSMTTPAPARPAPMMLDFKWDPDNPATIAAPKLSPGIYRADAIDRRSDKKSGADALVLVVSSRDYAGKQNAFAEAVALTKTWDESSWAKAAPSFLRAYLMSLVAAETETKSSAPPDKN